MIRDQKGPGPKFGKQDAKGNSAYVVPAKRKQGGEEPSAEERNKKPENDNRDKAREHEFKKQRQRELEIEREREREREKEKEREKARQRERERIDRERAAKGLPPSSPSSNLSRSATSIANLAEEGIYAERGVFVNHVCAYVLTRLLWPQCNAALSTSGERPRAPSSPKVASLSNSPGFRQRSFSMSNLGAATAAGTYARLRIARRSHLSSTCVHSTTASISPTLYNSAFSPSLCMHVQHTHVHIPYFSIHLYVGPLAANTQRGIACRQPRPRRPAVHRKAPCQAEAARRDAFAGRGASSCTCHTPFFFFFCPCACSSLRS